MWSPSLKVTHSESSKVKGSSQPEGPRKHYPSPPPAALAPPGPPSGAPNGPGQPSHFPGGESVVPLLRGRVQDTLSGSLTPPPPGPYPSRKRGVRPEGQSPCLWAWAAETRVRYSPLRPSLERGPHQGSELGFLGLRIRSLTAASTFRHLVGGPGPAGPDIRLAHGVLWAAPTHARKHARERAPKPHLAPLRGPRTPARRPPLFLPASHAPPLSHGCAAEPGEGRKRRWAPAN